MDLNIFEGRVVSLNLIGWENSSRSFKSNLSSVSHFVRHTRITPGNQQFVVTNVLWFCRTLQTNVCMYLEVYHRALSRPRIMPYLEHECPSSLTPAMVRVPYNSQKCFTIGHPYYNTGLSDECLSRLVNQLF